MIATRVVEKVLSLAVLFDIVKPVASRIVVKRYASSDFFSKVACIVCLIHLFGKTVLFAQQLFQPILGQQFLMGSTFHRQFFLELS